MTQTPLPQTPLPQDPAAPAPDDASEHGDKGLPNPVPELSSGRLSETPFDEDGAGGDQVELLAFSIGGQDYAIDIMSVREIRNWSEPTPLPRTPDYVRGVINLRGTVLPIIDLAKRLDLGTDLSSERAVYVVVKEAGKLFGMTVDSVSDILTVPRAMLLDPPTMADGATESCVESLILDEARMIRVLATDRLAREPAGPPGEVTAA